jgi:hypothetical protein
MPRQARSPPGGRKDVPENVLRSFRNASDAATIPTNKKGSIKPGSLNGRLLALGAAAAFALLILIVLIPAISRRNAAITQSQEMVRSVGLTSAGAKLAPRLSSGPNDGLSLRAPTAARKAMSAPTPSASPSAAAAVGETAVTLAQQAPPMIAHTVWLTIVVKDIGTARAALDKLLDQHHGYPAQLNINTPENSARSVQASLRIPAPELPAALADLRKLGRVQGESQSGEEVTQQHADLVARLKNARETEQRLIAILEQRTGKVEEVLKVEEQISNTRGEIERMEAEQKALEHRVDFASVDVQLSDEYKAQLNPPSTPVGTRLHNAFVAGIRNAADSLLAIVLFFEEYGPVLVIWLALLGAPLLLLWRRYRAVSSQP